MHDYDATDKQQEKLSYDSTSAASATDEEGPGQHELPSLTLSTEEAMEELAKESYSAEDVLEELQADATTQVTPSNQESADVSPSSADKMEDGNPVTQSLQYENGELRMKKGTSPHLAVTTGVGIRGELHV